jgi:hypothetical protein
VDTFAGMKAWIPLSLTLLLGQTLTPPTPSSPGPTSGAGAETPAEMPADPPAGGTADTRPGAAPDERPVDPSEEQSPEQTEEELPPAQQLARLRSELESLRTQLQARQAEEEVQRQEAQARLQTLEEEQELEAARARELEQLRQQRLESLELAYEWLISADQQLELGELDIGPALLNARRELSSALSSADDTGRGQTARLIERAADRLAVVQEAAEERDVYPARLELQAAGLELREAWRLTLNRSDATLINQ